MYKSYVARQWTGSEKMRIWKDTLMEVKAKSRFTERYYIGKYNTINICYTVIYLIAFGSQHVNLCSVFVGYPTLYTFWWDLKSRKNETYSLTPTLAARWEHRTGVCPCTHFCPQLIMECATQTRRENNFFGRNTYNILFLEATEPSASNSSWCIAVVIIPIFRPLLKQFGWSPGCAVHFGSFLDLTLLL